MQKYPKYIEAVMMFDIDKASDVQELERLGVKTDEINSLPHVMLFERDAANNTMNLLTEIVGNRNVEDIFLQVVKNLYGEPSQNDTSFSQPQQGQPPQQPQQAFRPHDAPSQSGTAYSLGGNKGGYAKFNAVARDQPPPSHS